MASRSLAFCQFLWQICRELARRPACASFRAHRSSLQALEKATIHLAYMAIDWLCKIPLMSHLELSIYPSSMLVLIVQLLVSLQLS